jgi:hypothetical protein
MNKAKNAAALEAAGASAGARQQNPALKTMLQIIMNMIIDKLRLDPKTTAYIYENMNDDRFAYGVDGGEVMFSTSAECKCKEDDCVATTYLTTSEAIAVALRLIEYAAKAYENEKELEKQLVEAP